MSELLSINGINFISASDAGKICKYTSDYITKLAREGKIEAKRMGRQWYVSPESLEAFVQRSQTLKKVRSAEIRQERRMELHTFSKNARLKIEELEISRPVEPKKNAFIAIQQTAIILMLGLSLGFGGHYISKEVPSVSYEASAITSGLDSLERLAIALYRLIAPEHSETFVMLPTPADPSENLDAQSLGVNQNVATNTSPYSAIIAAPSEHFTEAHLREVRSSFADEVEVSIDPNNPDSGIIVPIFREHRGDEYRFLMVPITPDQSGA